VMAEEGNWVVLGPTDSLAERPFTNPRQNEQDTLNLGLMICELRHQLGRLVIGASANSGPLTLHLRQDVKQLALDGVRYSGGRQYRIAFVKLEALRCAEELIVVGFCGHKRRGARRTRVNAVDEELIAESPSHPHFLSYSSLELKNGDWTNLVLFNHWNGLQQWNRSARHWQAVSEIAPGYYQSIRLHNALLSGGLFSGQKLTMIRTKYYDFGSTLTWAAVREYK
jgi:hypothetical protein